MRFGILGPLEVSQQHGPVRLGGPKERALLAILLLHANEPVSVDRLVEELWRGEPPATAEGTLQTYVSHVRKALGAAGGANRVASRAGGYVLRVDPDELDAQLFERLAHEGREAMARGSHFVASARLTEALSVWRGPPLADFAFQDFARDEITRLEESRLAALEDRIEADLHLGRHRELLGELESLVTANPLRERAWSHLMLALYRSGQQADALKAYENLRSALSEELGIDPTPALQRLHQALLRQEPELEWTAEEPEEPVEVTLPEPFPAGDRTPIVARERELQALRSWMGEASQGRGRLVLVSGEQGIGKTRITEELASEAAGAGVVPLRGSCYDVEAAAPYIPFLELVEAAARALGPGTFRAALGERAAEVARIMPEIRVQFPDIQPPLELPPEQERRFLFSSVEGFLRDLAHRRPLLLVLDDLHWADQPTLLLLEHLARRVSDLPALIVGTYRDVEVDADRPLARSLEELQRRVHAHHLSLGRLSREGVDEMLRALSGRAPPASLVRVIHEETEGNPFFVEEVFNHLSEEGRCFLPSGEFRADVEISEVEIPETVRLVIERRLSRLPKTARELLLAAAIVGRLFSFRLLQTLVDLQEDAMLDALEEAERARLIASVRDHEARFSFAHELIRQTLIAGCSGPRQQRLHLRVAEAIELMYGDSAERHAADLANHYRQAGDAADPRKTVHYLALAGDQAQRAAAFEEALRHFEYALSLVAANDTTWRAELLARKGAAQRSLGRFVEAIATWEEALATYQSLGDEGAFARLAREEAEARGWLGDFAGSQEAAARGLEALPAGPSADRGRLLSASAMALSYGGHFHSAEVRLSEGLALAEELGDDRLLGNVLHAKAKHHYGYMQPREALEAANRGAELLRATRSDWELAAGLGYLQWGASYLGEEATAAAAAEEAEALAKRLGHVEAHLVALRNRTVWEFTATADLELLERRARNDLSSTQAAGTPPYAYAWLGLVDFWRGRWDTALEHFRKGVEGERPGFWTGRHVGFLFRHLAYLGRREEALAMLEQEQHLMPRPRRANTLGAWTLLLTAVEGLAVLGEGVRAAGMYPMVLEAIDTGAIWRLFDYRFLHTVAGMAAGGGRNWEDAERHYRAALRLADEVPNRMEQPEARRLLAQMLIERDGPADRGAARSLLREALADYDRIGMTRHLEMARALLHSTGARHRPSGGTATKRSSRTMP